MAKHKKRYATQEDIRRQIDYAHKTGVAEGMEKGTAIGMEKGMETAREQIAESLKKSK